MAQPAAKAGTAVAHDAPHAKVFPPLDPTTFVPQLIWLVLTFGALYMVLSRIALPRIGEVIDARADRIRGDLGEAERLKDETKSALSAYETALGEAKAKAGAIAKETRDRLTAETDKERAAADALTSKALVEAEKRITETKAKALAGVGAIAAESVTAIVAKLTGATASTDEVQRALAAIKR